jgi:hypothetical protein
LLSFDRSEFRAWKAGTALNSYLRSLRSSHQGGRLGIVAHSMGNIVSGEALRLGAPADIQVMLQAAVPAGCYDIRMVLENADLVAKEKQKPTPDFDVEFGYRGFLENVSTPTINYYNTVDFALNLWFRNQLTKPDNPVGRGGYEYRNERAGFYSGKTLLREVTDVHESLAFLARARSLAVGAEPRTGRASPGTFISPFTSALDLQAAYGFNSQSSEHSAEFNRSIQHRLLAFYSTLVDSVSPILRP